MYIKILGTCNSIIRTNISEYMCKHFICMGRILVEYNIFFKNWTFDLRKSYATCTELRQWLYCEMVLKWIKGFCLFGKIRYFPPIIIRIFLQKLFCNILRVGHCFVLFLHTYLHLIWSIYWKQSAECYMQYLLYKQNIKFEVH